MDNKNTKYIFKGQNTSFFIHGPEFWILGAQGLEETLRKPARGSTPGWKGQMGDVRSEKGRTAGHFH